MPAAGGDELDVQAAATSVSAVAARSTEARPTGSPCSLAAPGDHFHRRSADRGSALAVGTDRAGVGTRIRQAHDQLGRLRLCPARPALMQVIVVTPDS